MKIRKTELSYKLYKLYENLLIASKNGQSREKIVEICYQIYDSFFTILEHNYQPNKDSQYYFMEACLTEALITTIPPSDRLLDTIVNVGIALTKSGKIVEITLAYMVQSVYYFSEQTDSLIERILSLIDTYMPIKITASAYSQLLIHYSSNNKLDKAEQIYKRFTDYIAIDNSEYAKAYYFLALGHYKFRTGNFYEAIYYFKKIISDEHIRKEKVLYYRANHTLSIAYASKSMMDLALKHLEIALCADSPLDKTHLKFMKARMLSQSKLFTQAIAILDEIKSISQDEKVLERIISESFLIAVMNEKTDYAQAYFTQLKADSRARIPLLFLYSYYLSSNQVEKIDIKKIEDLMQEVISEKRDFYKEYLFFMIEYYSKLNEGEKILAYLSKYRKVAKELELHKNILEMDYYHNLLHSYEEINQEEAIKKVLSSEAISEKIEKSIIGRSTEIKRIKKESQNVANATFSNVLITGETGTGKELLAKYIHYKSNRSKQNFCEFNLSAISPTLIESELFGYKKGAFTGADKDKLGILNIVDKGSLFLDEISEISLDIQTKLLKVLEDKEFYPLGSTQAVKSDFRIISATNKDLLQLTKENKFRIDLFYRLCNYEIKLPALRDRKSDIKDLANYFLADYCQKLNIPVQTLTPKHLEILMTYSFPGNIRELKNITQRIAISLANNEDLQLVLDNYLNLQNNCKQYQKDTLNLDQVIKDTVKDALIQTNGVQLQAAKLLGLTANSIARKIAKYKLYDYCR